MALNILAVTSEAFPLAKTGGLGDAVSGLAQSLTNCGAAVTLLLPMYRGVQSHLDRIKEVAQLDDLPGGNAALMAGHCPELNLPVLLLENDALYNREGIYVAPDGQEYPDNALRFAALAHAAARIARGNLLMARPDIVHAHDWHAALTPLLMHQAGIKNVKTILTLHNIAFQGVFPMELAAQLGIDERYCTDAGAEFWGKLSFLKAGIRFADVVTVVSGNYAREILTPKFGCGLQGLLAQRGSDLISIANGIDTKLWNPHCDPYLHGHQFDSHRLKNKTLCKRDLQQAFGLAEDAGATIMAMGSRLTTQKMADIAIDAIPRALDTYPSLQMCVMGRGDKSLEASLRTMAQRYPGRCGVHIGFDEPRAHLLHAGADILLHGSRFEPFGLTPLYSMRYGTIPIGSKVGGMVDTITDPGPQREISAMRGASGILFEGETADAMVQAIARAMTLREHPDIWLAMQKNGMGADFSWAKTAPAYMSLYRSLVPGPTRFEARPARPARHPIRLPKRAPASVMATQPGT
ncbi:MAG TPA: glycogen synthase GlgA [Eoetvoesiella sp.]